MKLPFICFALLVCASALSDAGPLPARAEDGTPAAHLALANATVLIIRHAEKPEEGEGLTSAGQARANAYVKFFQNYHAGDEPAPLKLTALFATARSRSSQRPLLTLEPLSKATGLPVDQQYKDHDYRQLAAGLQSTDHGRGILICWHHGEIPNLARSLGVDPDKVLPGGEWPRDEYAWIIQLRYDEQGRLKESKLVQEGF